MDRMVKVFVSGKDQKQVRREYQVIEPYDAFLLVKASAAQIRSLGKRYPVQDITDSYVINTPQGAVSTSTIERRARPKGVGLGKQRALKPGPHHYLVQFIGPIKQEWLQSVEKQGGAMRAPKNDFTWVVRADQKAIDKIQNLPFVRWTGHLPYKDRISPAILSKPARKPDDTSSVLPRTRVMPSTYVIEFFGQKELAAAVPKIKRLNFKIVDTSKRANLLTIAASDPPRSRAKSIDEISAIHGVRFIRERVIKRPSNDVATGIICSDSVRRPKGLGLDGKGEIVGICDTGIDTGNPATINKDFAGRLALVKSYPITPDFDDAVDNPGGDDGPSDMDSGHGTHVAGSVLGDGTNSVGIQGQRVPIQGLAHKAKLVFQAVEQRMEWKPNYHGQERYILSGIPADLTEVFVYAYSKGVRVHSNSWGGGDPGAYDQQCSQLDDFVWKNKDFCIVVAS
ncbi:MAG TPA: S8 family serine peptidase, partial [Terriglobales bacterium]|nr:S8 family serine peptidase [Terriglobales bacterium]